MRLGPHTTTVILLTVTLAPAAAQDQAPAASSTEELLERTIGVPDTGPQSASLAFESLMLLSGVPGGQVAQGGCNPESEPLVRLKASGTLKQQLASFSGPGSLLRWEVRDGVVDLLPAKGLPPLLLTRISTYDSQKAADIVTARTFLLDSPKIQDAASRLGLRQNVVVSGLGAASPRPAPPPKPLGLRLQNATLIDVLNALVRINKHGVWIYHQTHCGTTGTFDVNIAQ
jgi:hypothetical protein